MAIVITGHRGFIGSAVAKRFPDSVIIGLDSLEPRVHQSSKGGRRAGTLRYTEAKLADTVIHLAAQVGVADSAIDPRRYVDGNTFDTVEMLETLSYVLANGHQLNRIVVASSMSVYGQPIEHPQFVPETAPISPESVYGLTKYDQERLVLLWARNAGVSAVALRFFNVYGPGQALHNPYTGVIANFANWLLAGERPTVYEDGLQTRDFIHVDDVADAVALAATAPTLNHEVYNICTGNATSIVDVAHALAAGLGRDIAPNITFDTRPGDIRHCVGNPYRFMREFPQWQPRSFTVGIKDYCEWLLEHSSSAPTVEAPAL